MEIIERPSPNYEARAHGGAPDMIVIHYTGMNSAEEALTRLCNGDPDQPHGRVSAHYTIDLDGAVYRHVDPAQKAWHAGISHWRGRENLNEYSIGIELVNKGHEYGYHEFPAPQIQSLIALIHNLRQNYDIPLHHIVGHQDIAPQRKRDPGYLFPWRQLSVNGLALTPMMLDINDVGYDATPEDIRYCLNQIGYNTADDIPLSYLIRAFHARFKGHEQEKMTMESWPVMRAAALIFKDYSNA